MLPQKYPEKNTGRKGFVLVSVLWILAILTVLSLGFARRATIERQAAWYTLDVARAQQMARGAVERGIAELANKAALDAFHQQAGYTGLDQSWAIPVDVLHETDYFAASGDPMLAEERCVYQLTDCESRINVNNAPEEVLREIPGLSTGAVRKIVRRRDPQDDDFDPMTYFSIEQIWALDEVEDEDWFGKLPGEGLRDILTTWGYGQININTASGPVMQALTEIDAAVIQAILAYRIGDDGVLGTRDDKAFKSLDDLQEHVKMSGEKLTEFQRFCTLQSNYFMIHAYATLRGGKIVAHCSATVLTDSSSQRAVVQWSENVGA